MDKFRKAGRALYLAVQKTIVVSALFFAYFFGIGLMAALSRVFSFLPRQAAGKDSFWAETDRSNCGGSDAAEQS
ncbi:MAG TPA: hypothetical protein PKI19_08310 [Elusimicrobiales bacterium]|nr:hypothetical protein [Elusimicrobiales bacterium]